MRYLLSFCFFLSSLGISAQYIQDWYEKDHFFEVPEQCCHIKSIHAHEDVSYTVWDLTYNRLELNLDPNKLYIEGTVYFEITSRIEHLESVTIDLSSALTVTEVVHESHGLAYTHTHDKIDIRFPAELKTGDRYSFSVSYSGVPPETGFGSFTQHFRGDDNIPSLETLSEPYGAKEWWPCKQSLVDKIDSIDIIVTSPEKYETASNGLLVENSIVAEKRTCHWKHRHPIATYLVFLVTTEYEKYSDYATLEDGASVEILNYVFPEDLDYAKGQTPITADLIEKFSELFIDYPFKDEKYGHAQFSWGGGMEHQTMSSMGSFSNGLIAHELAHQWFGDYITCGSWQDIWLNEGFATYANGLYFEYFEPDWWEAWKIDIINKVTSEPDGSVFCRDTTSVSSIFSSRLSYKKGAYVLYMLRGQIGDEAFYKGIRNYLNDERVANGFGTTNLLRENFEQAADTVLNEYFNDWVMGEGHPVYKINCSYSMNSLSVNVEQKASATAGPLFDMKIPISLFNDGEESIIWLPNTKSKESFEYTINGSPDSVVVNRGLWVLGEFENTISSVSYIKNDELKVYFNSDRKMIYADIPNETKGDISIFNTSGQLIERQLWTENKKEISTQEFTNGVYIVRFDSENKSLATRISVY